MTTYTPTTEGEGYGVKGHYAYSRICDGLTQEQADAEFDRWLAEHDREVKADAWDKAYQAGVEDQWTSEAMQAGVTPNRINPYRQEQP